MKARQLIAQASYGPEQLKALGQAFDDAWDQISPSISGRPIAVEVARLRLAKIVLGLTRNGGHDPEQLTKMAVEAMTDSKGTPAGT